MDPSSSSSRHPHKPRLSPATLLPRKPPKSSFLVASLLVVVVLKCITLHRLQTPETSATFHPLKDPTVPAYTHPNMTWFMSTLVGNPTAGMPEHFLFPSRPPYDRLLCIDPANKTYALAAAAALPGAVLRGLTFVADSFYDYENPWHGLNALAGFLGWAAESGCPAPARFVVFKNGEAVRRVGAWVAALLEACVGRAAVEEMEGQGVVCFEKAVVMRRGLGKMSGERRHRLFEMVRCKAWKFCGVERREEGGRKKKTRITVIAREGRRAFRNETAVKVAMERECRTVEGCSLQLVHFANLSFCDQVVLMAKTDVLATVHGAQLSNMVFMARGSSVMEMFPKGWSEGAGVGQYIYRWFASWTQMSYEGAWRDPDGPDCPTPSPERRRPNCFQMHKDRPVGVNETFLAQWTASVLRRRRRGGDAEEGSSPVVCDCDAW